MRHLGLGDWVEKCRNAEHKAIRIARLGVKDRLKRVWWKMNEGGCERSERKESASQLSSVGTAGRV